MTTNNKPRRELVTLPGVRPAVEPGWHQQAGERLVRHAATSRYDADLVPAISILNRDIDLQLQVSCR